MEIVVEKSRYALQDHLHLITAPLQVIWGKQDQVMIMFTQSLGRACSFCFQTNPKIPEDEYELVTWRRWLLKFLLRLIYWFTKETRVSYSHCLLFVQVVDVSGAQVMAEMLPGCRVDLLDNCGHSVAMEKPCRTAKLILEFIISQQNARSGTKKSSWTEHADTPFSLYASFPLYWLHGYGAGSNYSVPVF